MQCCCCFIFKCDLHIIFLDFFCCLSSFIFCSIRICCFILRCIWIEPECSFFVCRKFIVLLKEVIRIFLVLLILNSYTCDHLTCKVLEFQTENTLGIFICFRFFADCLFFSFIRSFILICLGFCCSLRCCFCCHNCLSGQHTASNCCCH